jgi:hypothetical protein
VIVEWLAWWVLPAWIVLSLLAPKAVRWCAGLWRTLREEIVTNEDELDTTYSSACGISWEKVSDAIDRRIRTGDMK